MLSQVILTRAFGHGIQIHEPLRKSVDLCKNAKSVARLIIELEIGLIQTYMTQPYMTRVVLYSALQRVEVFV